MPQGHIGGGVGAVDGHPKDADGGAAVFHSCPVPGAVQPVGQAADDERPAAGQCLGLLLEEDRVEHHAVANHVDLIALKYTRRDRTQHVLLPVELQCMPGIGATLKAGHDLIMGGQHIDHLAFSFVAPLQTENDIDFFHLFSVICFMQKTFFAFKACAVTAYA